VALLVNKVNEEKADHKALLAKLVDKDQQDLLVQEVKEVNKDLPVPVEIEVPLVKQVPMVQEEKGGQADLQDLQDHLDNLVLLDYKVDVGNKEQKDKVASKDCKDPLDRLD